jgi:hypothetical protein
VNSASSGYRSILVVGADPDPVALRARKHAQTGLAVAVDAIGGGPTVPGCAVPGCGFLLCDVVPSGVVRCGVVRCGVLSCDV